MTFAAVFAVVQLAALLALVLAALKDAVTEAVKPHVAYEATLTRSATTWKLVSAGEAAGIVLLALVLIFRK
jgi:hypothetical protein